MPASGLGPLASARKTGNRRPLAAVGLSEAPSLVNTEPQPRQAGVGRALVCFAVRQEAEAFRKLARARADVGLLLTGMGRHNARFALDRWLATENPARVLSCGFAGGLNPALALGEVVFETADESLRQTLVAAGAKPGRFHCLDRVVVTAAEKAALWRDTGADAVDMESAAIQDLCRQRQIPCATVRVVLDTASETLPLDFNRLVKPDLSLDYGKLALALARRPGTIPALRRLQADARFAAQRLAEVLARVIGPR